MDENTIRQAAEAHGLAVREGDIDHIKADLIPDLHVHIPGIADVVPSPLESTRVEAVEVFDGYAESIVAYLSPAKTLRMKSRWEDRGAGRPQIVESVPV